MVEVPEKNELEHLRDRLAVTPRLVWDQVDRPSARPSWPMASIIKSFWTRAKTEREAVTEIERLAKALGFVDLAGKAPGPPGLL